nr:MAG: Kef-type K+ transport family [Candidatus Nanosalinarum sp. J07AB56]
MSEIIEVLPAVFIASSLVLLLAKRLSVPAYSAYIVTGALLSALAAAADSGLAGLGIPAVSQAVSEAVPGQEVLGSGALVGVAEVGAAFLIFVAAVRVSPTRIREFGTEGLKAASAQILLQHVIGFAAGLYLGLSPLNSFFVGFTASISSSLVSLDLVEDDAQLDILYGRLTESISVIDDAIAALITVVIVSGAATGGVVTALIGAAFVVVPYVLRGVVARFLLSEFREDPEIMLLIGVSAVVLLGYGAQVAGVNPIAGVFGAGLLLSRDPVNTALIESLKSVKDFFSAIFFVSLGALAQIPGPDALWISGVIVASVVLVRPLSIVGILRREGFDSYTSYKTALSLDQVSEFTLFAALLTHSSGLLSAQVFEAVVFSAAVTFVTSDVTTRYADSIYGALPEILRFEDIEESEYGFNDKEGHDILVGYGEPGRAAAKALDSVVVIANNPEEVERAGSDNMDVVFGDPMNESTWTRAGVEGASHIVSTVEDDDRARSAAQRSLPCVLLTSTEGEAQKLESMDNVLAAGTPESLASEKFHDSVLSTLDRKEEK